MNRTQVVGSADLTRVEALEARRRRLALAMRCLPAAWG